MDVHYGMLYVVAIVCKALIEGEMASLAVQFDTTNAALMSREFYHPLQNSHGNDQSVCMPRGSNVQSRLTFVSASGRVGGSFR